MFLSFVIMAGVGVGFIDEYCCGYDIGDDRLDSLIMDVFEGAMLDGLIA